MEEILLRKTLTIKGSNRPQRPDQDFEALQPFTDYIFIYIYIHTQFIETQNNSGWKGPQET